MHRSRFFAIFQVLAPQKLLGPSPHLGSALETPPLSFGKSFMKIRSAVPENGCFIFMHYRVADGNSKKTRKNICKTYTHLRPLATRMRKLVCHNGTVWNSRPARQTVRRRTRFTNSLVVYSNIANELQIREFTVPITCSIFCRSISISINIYSCIWRFPCDSTAFFLYNLTQTRRTFWRNCSYASMCQISVAGLPGMHIVRADI